MFRCPRRAATAGSPTPAITSLLAVACLRQYRVKFSIFAASTAAGDQPRESCNGSPVRTDGNACHLLDRFRLQFVERGHRRLTERNHPRLLLLARRTASQRVIADSNSERLCISENVRERSGQVLVSRRSAKCSPVFQHKDVVPAFTDLSCIRKAFMQAGDLGEAAPWTDDRKRSPSRSAQEEKTCILLLWVQPVLRF